MAAGEPLPVENLDPPILALLMLDKADELHQMIDALRAGDREGAAAVVATLSPETREEHRRLVALIESDRRLSAATARALAAPGEPVTVRHRGCDGLVARLEGDALRYGWGAGERKVATATPADLDGLLPIPILCRKCGAQFTARAVWSSAKAGRKAGRATQRINPL